MLLSGEYVKTMGGISLGFGMAFIRGFNHCAVPSLERELAIYGTEDDLCLPDLRRRDKIISILFHFDKAQESFSVLDKLCGV